MGDFTVVWSVPWPLNICEAGGDLVLLQTFLLLMCESWYFKLTSSWTWSFVTYEKQEGLLQNKFMAILASVQRPGHWGHNCKMAYKCSSNCAMPTSWVKASTISNLSLPTADSFFLVISLNKTHQIIHTRMDFEY